MTMTEVLSVLKLERACCSSFCEAACGSRSSATRSTASWSCVTSHSCESLKNSQSEASMNLGLAELTPSHATMRKVSSWVSTVSVV